MIRNKLYNVVIALTLLTGCGSATAAKPKKPVDLVELSEVLTFVEEAEDTTLSYLEATTNERMRVEEIYKANRILVEAYIAEQKKTQQACKRETGNLAPGRINRISPVQPLSEQQIEELNKATSAAAMELRSENPPKKTRLAGKAKTPGWPEPKLAADVVPVLAPPPTVVDPPYSPSDAP